MDPEALTQEFRTEHDADIWLDRLARTHGLAGASFTQLSNGWLRVTARLTSPDDNPSEQEKVTSLTRSAQNNSRSAGNRPDRRTTPCRRPAVDVRPRHRARAVRERHQSGPADHFGCRRF